MSMTLIPYSLSYKKDIRILGPYNSASLSDQSWIIKLWLSAIFLSGYKKITVSYQLGTS